MKILLFRGRHFIVSMTSADFHQWKMSILLFSRHDVISLSLLRSNQFELFRGDSFLWFASNDSVIRISLERFKVVDKKESFFPSRRKQKSLVVKIVEQNYHRSSSAILTIHVYKIWSKSIIHSAKRKQFVRPV